MRSIHIALAALALIAIAPYAARAQQAPWRTFVEQGLELHRQNHDDAALELFRQAYVQSAAPMALGQLALSEQRLGRWLDAEEHMNAVLATAGDQWVERNRPALTSARDVIRTHVGGVEVIGGGVPGAGVRVDGHSRGSLPMAEPARAAAGSVVVEVAAPGYFPVTRIVNVVAGGVARETINLVPQQPAVAVREPTRAPCRATESSGCRDGITRSVRRFRFVPGATRAARRVPRAAAGLLRVPRLPRIRSERSGCRHSPIATDRGHRSTD